ncbi:MAG: hypothetical protein KGY75_02315 [Candidatus Cloacimonetes bacterium]|nr:hypothetical protein [Candidatus Cloacimonadota bacterium]MBS3766943.1 hypothetical protein [Candidatus Cloacimonadota bacterium]
MIKKIFFVAFLFMIVAQLSFADGFNSAEGTESETKSDTYISELINYLFSLKFDIENGSSKSDPEINDEVVHRRGHRIRRKIDDDKKEIDDNHK